MLEQNPFNGTIHSSLLLIGGDIMLISTKGRYALRMVIALAKLEDLRKSPISLKDIAEAECVSMKYLEQLARCLSAADIITSVRGKYGGYRLAHPAEEITAGDILRAAEGSTAPVSCLEGGAECPRESVCTTVSFWRGLDNVIEQYIDNVSLSELLK